MHVDRCSSQLYHRHLFRKPESGWPKDIQHACLIAEEDPDEPADKRWLTLSHLEPAIRAAVAQQEAITAPPAGSGDQRKHAALPPARPAAPDVQPGSSFGSEAQLHPLKSLSAGPQVEPRAGSQPNRPCMLQQNVHPGSRPTWPSLQERHSPQERTGLLVAHVGLDSHAATFRNPPAATATAVGPMAAQGLAQGLAPPQWLPAPPPPPQQSAFPPFTVRAASRFLCRAVLSMQHTHGCLDAYTFPDVPCGFPFARLQISAQHCIPQRAVA